MDQTKTCESAPSPSARRSELVEVAWVERVADDAVVMALEAPALAAAAQPGQFVMVRFPGVRDPLLPRPLSVHDVEGGAVLLLIRAVGRATRALAAAAPGAILHVTGPLGRGFRFPVPGGPGLGGAEGGGTGLGGSGPVGRVPVPACAGTHADRHAAKDGFRVPGSGYRPEGAGFRIPGAGQPTPDTRLSGTRHPEPGTRSWRHILVGGGMGVAPLPFLLRRLQAVPGAEVRVVAGARTEAGLYALDRLAPGSPATIVEEGGSGRLGLVTDLLAEALSAEGVEKAVYACGPEAMLAAVARMCTETGTSCQVSLEAIMACGTGLCHGCAVRLAAGGYARACTDGPVFDAATLAIPWS